MRRRDVGRVAATMLAALVAGGLVACARGGQQAVQQSATPPASPSSATATATGFATASPSQSVPPQLPLLGPTGYGALKLGMTKAQAQPTGLTTGMTPGAGGCGYHDGYLVGSPNPNGTAIAGRLFFSNTTGRLVAIYAFPGVMTPQGIKLGSTYAQLHAAYPTWQPIPGGSNPHDGRGGAPVPGNAHAGYRIVVLNGKVVELSLDSDKQDCYE
jgi:hypothetical protein